MSFDVQAAIVLLVVAVVWTGIDLYRNHWKEQA